MSIPKHLQISSIVNYNRKSRQDIEREKRTGEDTLSEIIHLMTGYLDKQGIPYVIRNEIGSGDKIETRPVFQEVLKELEEGIYDAIAVKDISRLGRGSYTDMGKIYDLIIDKRIYIITPYKTYDPQNSADLRQIRFELFLSREEFETIRERLAGGRYNGAMQGRWVAGQAPFGYVYNPNTQKLDIDEENAKIIRMIYDFYVNGIPQEDGTRKDVSFRAIATHLRRLKIRTPSGINEEWRVQQVRRVLENPAYHGEVHYRTRMRKGNKYFDRPEDEHIIVKDAHEKIIDTETWEKAQAKLNDKSRKIPRSKLDFSPCELAGIFVCKKCGRKMVRQYSVQRYKKKNGEVSIYEKEFLWCTTSQCSFVKYRDAEEGLLGFLEELKEMDDETLTQSLKELTEEDDKDKDNEVIDLKEHIEQKRKELNNRLQFIFEKFETGVYSDEIFLQRKSAIEKELKELDEIIINEKKDEDKVVINVDEVRGNLQRYLDVYNKLENKTRKNELLREIFSEVLLEITKKGRGRKSAEFKIYPKLKDKGLVDF